MRLILFLLLCSGIAAACNMQDRDAVTVRGHNVTTDTSHSPVHNTLGGGPVNTTFVDTLQIARIKVLENGTVTYVFLNWMERATFIVGDTIWVDLGRHVIDDTSNTAMKARILMRID